MGLSVGSLGRGDATKRGKEMRRVQVKLAMILVGLICWGCGRTEQTEIALLQPVVQDWNPQEWPWARQREREILRACLQKSPEAPFGEQDSQQGPRIEVLVAYSKEPVATYRALGLDVKKAFEIVACKRLRSDPRLLSSVWGERSDEGLQFSFFRDPSPFWDALFPRRDPKIDPPTRVLAAPRVFSGECGVIGMSRATEKQAKWIRDYEYVRGDFAKPGTLKPVGYRLGDDFFVADVQARVQDSQTVIVRIKPVFRYLHALRRCSAMVALDGNERSLEWVEPLLLMGLPLRSVPEEFCLRPDQVLSLPIRWELAQPPPALVRLLAKGGKVTERIEAAPKSKLHGDAPSALQYVVIVAASAVPPAQPVPTSRAAGN